MFRLESLSEHLFGLTFDEVRKSIVCFKDIFMNFFFFIFAYMP